MTYLFFTRRISKALGIGIAVSLFCVATGVLYAAPLSVNSGTITILQPIGGEKLVVGTKQQIVWTTKNLSSDALVTILFSDVPQPKPGFSIADNISASSGSFTWTVSSPYPSSLLNPSKQWWIFVVLKNNPELGGMSKPFAILPSTPTPSFFAAAPPVPFPHPVCVLSQIYLKSINQKPLLTKVCR